MTLRSFDPSDPDRLVAEVEEPSPGELEAALENAVEAQREWSADAPGRSAALGAFAEAIASREAELTEQMVREVGKPVTEARAEVGRAVAILRYYAQAALDPEGELFPGSAPRASVIVRRRPLGVVLAINPWNFPLAIPLWKAAPALAYGNAVIAKPAGAAIGVGELIGAAAAESLPAGVLTVAFLSGSRAGALLDDPRIAGVSFTGSTEVGLALAARLAARGAPAQAEMGGQNPAIALADADPADAAAKILAGAMSYSGQKCSATRRAIAVGAVAGPLEDELAARVAALAVGDPAHESTVVGPLIDGEAVAAFEARVAGALARGARVVGTADAPDGPGHFVSPTVLALDDPDDEVNQEETFGPLLTLIRVAGDEGRSRSPTRPGSGWSAPCTGATSTAPPSSPPGSTAACSASTRRPPELITTCCSAAMGSPASARASRVARRASSSPRRGR
jgi:alpha-ketoglutaric semialdehyde dehydrogenase